MTILVNSFSGCDECYSSDPFEPADYGGTAQAAYVAAVAACMSIPECSQVAWKRRNDNLNKMQFFLHGCSAFPAERSCAPHFTPIADAGA